VGSKEHISELGKATRFSKDDPRPGPGRPKTNIVREYCRKLAAEKDPKTKRLISEELAYVLLKGALKGKLAHWQQFVQFLETDGPVSGAWPGQQFGPDSDSREKLARKILGYVPEVSGNK
jgi:hypothetical protein